MGHEVVLFNPYNLQTDLYPDLADAGYNLLTPLPRPDDPRFMLEVLALGDASITESEGYRKRLPLCERRSRVDELACWLRSPA